MEKPDAPSRRAGFRSSKLPFRTAVRLTVSTESGEGEPRTMPRIAL